MTFTQDDVGKRAVHIPTGAPLGVIKSIAGKTAYIEDDQGNGAHHFFRDIRIAEEDGGPKPGELAWVEGDLCTTRGAKARSADFITDQVAEILVGPEHKLVLINSRPDNGRIELHHLDGTYLTTVAIGAADYGAVQLAMPYLEDRWLARTHQSLSAAAEDLGLESLHDGGRRGD